VKGYPWIYYLGLNDKSSGNDNTVIGGAELKLKVALSPSLQSQAYQGGFVHVFNFLLAKYTLEGEYLGLETLTDQLLFCPHNLQDGITS
jgi:hypothetical protein